MKTTTLLVAVTLLGLAGLAAPAELSPVGTADAQTCTPYLVEGDTKSYLRCTEQQCQWQDFPRGPVVCYD